MLNNFEDILLVLSDGGFLEGKNRNIQIAFSSLILNYSVAFVNNMDFDNQARCMNVIGTVFLPNVTDFEAQFRVLVAMGTLVKASAGNVQAAKNLQVRHTVVFI